MQTALNIPLLQILSFWSDLDTDGRDSLYLSLFQNKAVLNPPDPTFQLQYVASLAALPTLEFPSPTFPNLSFEVKGFLGVSVLTLHGTMSDDEFRLLEDLSNEPLYLAVINQLHGAGSGDLHWAPINELPVAKLLFPLIGGGGTIGVIGAMSDDQRGNLNLSSAPAYQTAVDALYEMRTLPGVELAFVEFPRPSIPTISGHINQILAPLRISSQDLGLILAYTGLTNATLALANLSTLCRYVFLAQGLNLSISDLLSLIALIGVDPFKQLRPTSKITTIK